MKLIHLEFSELLLGLGVGSNLQDVESNSLGDRYYIDQR